MKGGDLESRVISPVSFHPSCGLDLDELGVGMGDNGGEHDAADDQRPGGVPINPKHFLASDFASLGLQAFGLQAFVLASSARETGG